ncbi:MAG: Rieske (2Fe-2S) protein, partial [Solirubrobacterales bacterium]
MAEEGNDKQGAPKGLPSPDPAGYFEGESMNRRAAFTIGVQALGGIAGAAIVLPAIGFAAAPLFEQEKEPWQAVGSTSDFTADTYRTVVITAVEGIGETGKTTVYVRRGNPDPKLTQNGKYPPETADEYIAITTRCAHLGCPVRYVQAAGNFICPCHGGVYGFLGERIGGPPVRPLDRFQTRVTNGQVEIGPRY